MSYRYEPIGDKILLRPITENKTSAGILLPEDRERDFARGEVIAVGEGTPDVPMAVKPGQVVLYVCRRAGGADTYLPIDDYILVSQLYVVAVCIDEK
jgi:co-chaperonin GroES (HSP10)